MGSGRQSTFWAPSGELGPMIGEALGVIGDTACDKWVDVYADMHFCDGSFHGGQTVVVSSTESDEPSTLVTSKTELLAPNHTGSVVHSSLSVDQSGDGYATVSELSQNEAGGIDKVTRRRLRGGGRGVLPGGEIEPASVANVTDMVREAMGYAKPLPQSWPEREQELPRYSDTDTRLVASKRIVPVYARLLSMVGRAIAEFNSAQSTATHLDVELCANFVSTGRVHDCISHGQGIKISANNRERRQSATFTLRLDTLDLVRFSECCLLEECSLRVEDHSANRQAVTTEDRLALHQHEGDMLYKWRGLPYKNNPSVTTYEQVQGDRCILRMASTVLGLVAASPLSAS